MVLWIPFAGLFGISSSATLSSYSSNCFNYIDAKSFFRTGQTWGRVGYTESGKRVRVLSLYNYRFPSERNFLQGPWIGFKTPEKAVGSYGWVGVIITRIRRRIIGCLLLLIYYYNYHILCDPLYTVKLKGWGGNEKRSSDLATYLRSPRLWRRSSCFLLQILSPHCYIVVI